MSKKRKKNTTRPLTAEQRLRRQKLAEAKQLHRQATRAAEADPENHELRAIAFAYGGTVKLIEGLIDDET